ncbi:hypothetical protein LEP1GSC082_4589 [Leptospira kirschneri str. H2]|nr:hypothetical protein LEP1GSC082_4589 [Leptospira kirschneri str. H2]
MGVYRVSYVVMSFTILSSVSVFVILSEKDKFFNDMSIVLLQ